MLKHGMGFIQPEDQFELNMLRLREQKQNGSIYAHDRNILWNTSDDCSKVLGIWNRGKLIASMRLENILDLKKLEEKLEASLPLGMTAQFPLGIFSKAATASIHKDEGLNALLRYHLLKEAEVLGITQIWGTVEKGSRRSHALREMGYEFFAHSKDWAEIIFLDLTKNRKRASSYCAKLSSHSLLIYPRLTSASV